MYNNYVPWKMWNLKLGNSSAISLLFWEFYGETKASEHLNLHIEKQEKKNTSLKALGDDLFLLQHDILQKCNFE